MTDRPPTDPEADLLERFRERSRAMAGLAATLGGGGVAGVALLPQVRSDTRALGLALIATAAMFLAILIHTYAGNVLIRKQRGPLTATKRAVQAVRRAQVFGYGAITVGLGLFLCAVVQSQTGEARVNVRLSIDDEYTAPLRDSCPSLPDVFEGSILASDSALPNPYIQVRISGGECLGDERTNAVSLIIPTRAVLAVRLSG
ncbi:hypothetical protein [Nocardioides lijunqiniae]|uniref:hypothetical protein n=1 Tax=Nocardioides lijunqiniae TaxID=2760832 RepID=UPI00187778C3|nr:hypothetical protein [Nocardioides lijunqiniae]